MYQGTTTTLVLTLDSPTLDLDKAEVIWFTLSTSEYSKTFDTSRCVVRNSKRQVLVSLTQEETLELPLTDLDAQLRILLSDGRALVTNIVKIKVDKILKGGVIE